MRRERAHIGLKTKLAAAVAHLLEIPYEHQLLMSEDQICSLVQWHHDPIPHGPPFNGTDEFHNLDPISIMAHRKETAEKTVPTIAKIKRGLTKREQKAQERAAEIVSDAIDMMVGRRRKPKFQWPKGRKIQSRPFPKRGKNASADK
jgi:hypothetical protein